MDFLKKRHSNVQCHQNEEDWQKMIDHLSFETVQGMKKN